MQPAPRPCASATPTRPTRSRFDRLPSAGRCRCSRSPPSRRRPLADPPGGSGGRVDCPPSERMTPTEKNPYEAPRAALDTGPSTAGLSLSLQDALAGRYRFTVGEVMEEAWELVKGMKASFWGAAIVIGLIYLTFNTLVGFIVGRFVTGDL